uniref:Uncharacterized protein n=1 Tax=Pithovirus LCDPAC01 TaxID=2506600 RepID=A0A481YQ87_9VIRU|nr:MAG: hypothetical protein LCDPAC01_00640 [Pithovirus LCDPAC01]
MRILVCDSQYWNDIIPIHRELKKYGNDNIAGEFD